MLQNIGHSGAMGFSSAPTDKMLQAVGLNTSTVMLGLMIIFLVASFAHEWASGQRESRVHRALYRLAIICVSMACAALLILNYQGMN